MINQSKDKQLECMVEFSSAIIKEIVAFLNTNGGTIIVGTDNNGKNMGIEDAKVIIKSLSTMIHEAIRPEASLLCSAQEMVEDGKTLVRIEIGQGVKKPYYLYERGLTSNGVYIRINNTSQPASEYAIKQMIIESDEKAYVSMECIEQDLTFEYLETAFVKAQVELKMNKLYLIDTDNKYTNLALLLSDQCPFSIKTAVFDGDNKSKIIDRKVFVGSLIKQVDEVYTYLTLNNKNRGAYNGLLLEDKFDYNNLALREGLLNAIIHRDYSLNGSNLINIYNNRIEFISIGGLVSDMTYNDIMLGISRTRNERLANVFFVLKYAGANGSGIEKINGDYKHIGFSPTFEISDHGFLLTLPNKNNYFDNKMLYLSEDQQVLDYICRHGKATRAEIQANFGFKLTKTRNLLKGLSSNKKISIHGNGKNIIYTIK